MFMRYHRGREDWTQCAEATEEENSKPVNKALVTQRGKGASDIASKASLATARITKPKSIATQSIDNGVSIGGEFVMILNLSCRFSVSYLYIILVCPRRHL